MHAYSIHTNEKILTRTIHICERTNTDACTLHAYSHTHKKILTAMPNWNKSRLPSFCLSKNSHRRFMSSVYLSLNVKK